MKLPTIDPTYQHMLLDLGTAAVTGALLSAADYLITNGTWDWRLFGAAVLVGVAASIRKWLQTQSLPPVEPPKA